MLPPRACLQKGCAEPRSPRAICSARLGSSQSGMGAGVWALRGEVRVPREGAEKVPETAAPGGQGPAVMPTRPWEWECVSLRARLQPAHSVYGSKSATLPPTLPVTQSRVTCDVCVSFALEFPFRHSAPQRQGWSPTSRCCRPGAADLSSATRKVSG